MNWRSRAEAELSGFRIDDVNQLARIDAKKQLSLLSLAVTVALPQPVAQGGFHLYGVWVANHTMQGAWACTFGGATEDSTFYRLRASADFTYARKCVVEIGANHPPREG